MEKKFGDCYPYMCGTTITANGDPENINCSDILTKLIQEAGRYCRYYASDLFIWWPSIANKIKSGTLESGSGYFGFYKSGVNYTEDPEKKYLYNEYISIWKLDRDVSEDGEIRLKLSEMVP